jgi:excinuclease ABC subunit C
VTYNRKRRTMRTVTSELLKIPGVGPSKRSALLRAFGSVQGVREASVEQIAALPGFSPKAAQKILDALRAASPFADAPDEPGTPVTPLNGLSTSSDPAA